MSVEELDKVDWLVAHARPGVNVLAIADGLDWTDEPAHLRVLARKLDAYVDGVTSGQIVEAHPAAANATFEVHVFLQHGAPAACRELLRNAARVLAKQGIGLVAFHGTTKPIDFTTPETPPI